MEPFSVALKNPVPPPKKDDLDEPGDQPGADASIKKKKNSRRKHRNSHLGCGTCKKRRIKCDENLPACLNCTKGKLHCAYMNLDLSARSALRMAQHNQNIRQDRHAHDHDDALSLAPSIVPATTSPLSGTIPPAGGSFAVPYPILQAAPMGVPPQHVIQSPYGPLVSIQPLSGPLQYSQMPVMAGQVPVIYSQVPVVSDAQMHQAPQSLPMQPVVSMPGSGPALAQEYVPLSARSSISEPLGPRRAPSQTPAAPLSAPLPGAQLAFHTQAQNSGPLGLLAPSALAASSGTMAQALMPPGSALPGLPALSETTDRAAPLPALNPHPAALAPPLSDKEDAPALSAPAFPRGVVGSYTALPALLSATYVQKLSRSAESTPVLAGVKPVITSTAVIHGIRADSSSEESDREVRLPPIKNLNVSEMDKKLDAGSNTPNISKLIS